MAAQAHLTPSPLAGEGRGEGFGRTGSMPVRAMRGAQDARLRARPLPPTAARRAPPSPAKGEGIAQLARSPFPNPIPQGERKQVLQ